MAYDIGPKIGIEGEKEFRDALKQVNTSLKTLGTEMKAVTSAYDKNDNSASALTAKNKVLNKQIDEQKGKLSQLERGLQASKEKYGENDAVTQKWQQSVNQATADLNKMERELGDNVAALKNVERGYDDAGNKLDEFGNIVEQTEKKTSRFGEIFKGAFWADLASRALTAVIGKLKEFARAAIEAADRIGTMSDIYSLSTDRLQELEFAGIRLDVSLETMTGSMTKLVRNMNSARAGSKLQTEAFKKLGIEITNADGSLRSANTVFGEAIDALGRIRNETERDAIAMQLFGKSAMDLNPLIVAGSEELEMLSDKAHEMGAVMTEETIAALDNLDETLEELKFSAKSTLGNLIVDFADFGGLLSRAMEDSSDAVVEVIPAVSELEAAIGALNIEYEVAKETVASTLESIVSGWDAVPPAVALSAEQVIANLQSQMDWMASYRENLDALMSRQIPGADMSALIASLSDGSTESAAILAGLRNATDDQVAQITQGMAGVSKGKEAFVGEIAAAQIDYDERMADMVNTTAEAVKEMDLSDKAKESALNTINGYINGVRSQSGSLNLAMTKAAQDALNAWKKVFKEASPSRAMMESGENAIKGAIIGVEKKQGELVQLYTAMGEKLLDGLSVGMMNSSGKAMETVDDVAKELAQRIGSIASAFAVSSDIAELQYNLWELSGGKGLSDKDKQGKKSEMLQRQIDLQKRGIDSISEAYAKMVELTGEGSDESLKLQKQLLQEQIGLEKLKDTLYELNTAKEAAYSTDKLTKMAEQEFKLWSLENQSASDSEKLAKQAELLALKYEMQGAEISGTEEALAEMVDQYGASAEESVKLQEQLLKEKIAYMELKKQIDEVNRARGFVGGGNIGASGYLQAANIWAGLNNQKINTDISGINSLTRQDVGGMIAGAVNAMGTITSGQKIVVEAPVYFNDKEVARAITPAIRAFDASSPQVRSDRL